MVTTVQLVDRADVPQEQTWNAEVVFADAQAWYTEFEAVKDVVPSLAEYKGKLSDPDTLVAYLEESSQIRRRLMTLGFYCMMNGAVHSFDNVAKEMQGQIMGVYGQAGAMIAFAEPEILAMGEETVMGWVESHEGLSLYEKYLSNLFRLQAHKRSAEVEQVLGLLTDPFRNTENIADELTNTDLQFPDAIDSDNQPFEVTQSTIELVKANPDREIRRTGWKNYAESYLQFKNTLANTYLTSVKQSTFGMRVRNYESVLHMKLFPNNLPVEVFHNLIDTYQKNLPTWHRYWDVKRRALGYDEIHPYDIWAPLTENEPEVSFEQSVDWICTALAPLGEEYVDVLRRGCLEERWVDRSVNKGKRQGAFSYGSYDTAPYIMMSYDNLLGGMSTLAHELGHSMHSYYTRKTQPEIYGNYSMFAAEVASNFNQAMTRSYLFEQYDDRDFQLALIQEAMDNFHRYFFIMPTLARFEYEVHDRVASGKPMSADILNGIMADLYAEGYGDAMTDNREHTGITWAQFGHLYEAYYTFQYATGISAAHALAAKVSSGDPQAAENYLKFLSAGSALDPLDALKLAGVDMTTPEAVESTFAELTKLVDRLESLI